MRWVLLVRSPTASCSWTRVKSSKAVRPSACSRTRTPTGSSCSSARSCAGTSLSDRGQLPPDIGQHLGNMAHLGRVPFTLQSPGDVEQASKVTRHNCLCPRRNDVAHLVRHHAHGDLWIL